MNPSAVPTAAAPARWAAARTALRLARPPLWLLLAALVALLALAELRTSRLQAALASHVAREISFRLEAGKNPAMRFPASGPHDERLGYTALPGFVSQLESAGFEVKFQARSSERLRALMDWGLPAIYHEKIRAGLSIEDHTGRSLAHARHPGRVYRNFASIPPLVVQTLLFIENRELLAPGSRTRNPVIEWDRLAAASLSQLSPRAQGQSLPGGSTLATQLEKYLHSPGGYTGGTRDKLRQIGAATLRAYLDGPDTTAARKRIALDYLNSVPLSARAGFGELRGLGDALWAWHGADFAEVNAVLSAPPGADGLTRRARAYRQVLSLMLAQRRPSGLLIGGHAALRELTDRHLVLLEQAGVIDARLRDAALATILEFRPGAPPTPPASFAETKAVDAVRAELLSLLHVPGTYELDRLDAQVTTTLDVPTQTAVRRVLQDLRDPHGLGGSLREPRLLARGDPSKVVYSFSLYESAGDANVLRAQVDTLDQPFNVNRGMKLDLGSTAKLRTLVQYLEMVSRLWERWHALPGARLALIQPHRSDAIGAFVLETLRARPGIELAPLLEAALDRRFSANPGTLFFTGGGLHRFANFDEADDAHVMTLRTAFRHSVNLPFVRLMREIVDHTQFGPDGFASRVLDDPADPMRAAYLERFVAWEGRLLFNRFFAKHAKLTPEQRSSALLEGQRVTPRKLTLVQRSIDPDADLYALRAVLMTELPEESAKRLSEDQMTGLYEGFQPAGLSYSDRGWLTGIHPIELWLVSYLNAHPGASRGEVLLASQPVRREAYAWLLKSKRRGAQNLRIRILLEQDAFARIHADWRRLGYPFASLVPSLATAIGSSADRPDALAELLGIVQGGGLRRATTRIEELRFAEGTPFATVLRPRSFAPERVLRSEVANAVRAALVDVVEAGTAVRARGAFALPDGTHLALGGKTGTGDNRIETYSTGLRLERSQVTSRSATFAFLIGDRHFGVITAYVEGEDAAGFGFTSSLPVEVLKRLAPALVGVLQEPVNVATAPHRRRS
ncbi:MAG TPA: transglycosylase domain-containing protein [Myxococcota bacterium]